MKPTALDCTEVQAQLPLYVGGDLDVAASGSMAAARSTPDLSVERIRRHLANCSTCADELRRLRDALSAIAALRDERLPQIDVWSGVRAELSVAGLLMAMPRNVAVPRSAAPGVQPVAIAAAVDAAPGTTANTGKTVTALRFAQRRWRRVAAAIALVGLGAALWNIARRDPSSEQPDSPPIAEFDGGFEHGLPVEVPGASVLAPMLVADTGASGNDLRNSLANSALVDDAASNAGLRKVGAEETELWRQAQRFGTPTAVRRSNGGWQAASYPVYDPRVR